MDGATNNPLQGAHNSPPALQKKNCGDILPSKRTIAISAIAVLLLAVTVLAGYSIGYENVASWMSQRSVEILGQGISNGIWVGAAALLLAVGGGSYIAYRCVKGKEENRLPIN